MFKVSIQGMQGVKAQFVAASERVAVIVGEEIEKMAGDWVLGAVQDAPVDQGKLKGSISFSLEGSQAIIVAQTFYAPFIEFGTKGKYLPIPGTEAIAQQFQGMKGGNFQEMLKFIELWVARKGIAGTYSTKTRKRTGGKALQSSQNKSAAFAIALSILKHGLTPHPFFFKQQEIVWPIMIARIKQRIESGSRVSVIAPGEIYRPKIVTI